MRLVAQTPFLFGLTTMPDISPKMSRRFAYVEVSSFTQRERFYCIPNGAYFRSERYDHYDDVWGPTYHDMATGALYIPGHGGPGGPGADNIYLCFMVNNRRHCSSGPGGIAQSRVCPFQIVYHRRGRLMGSVTNELVSRYFRTDNSPSVILYGKFIKWGHFDPMQGLTKGYRADGPCQVNA